MKITGIICEYNPMHLGHAKQISHLREASPEGGIVCLMSGNYVQRGMPAIFDKEIRAKAAILSGADLMLELPVTAALSSAEGFAAEGVRILGGFCQDLCFGAEDADPDKLMALARVLLSPDFSVLLRQALASGCSFPAARQKAVEMMGHDGNLLSKPNNILAIEYCKAILSQNLHLHPMPISRQGDYHDSIPNPENPSATALRCLIESNQPWDTLIPAATKACYQDAAIHTIHAGERAILAKLRTMDDADFEKLPYGSEGLWRKLMKNARQYATLEEILTATKTKRYTRSRLDRMVMCAFLDLTQNHIATSAPYTRVLAFNDRGREILNLARQSGRFINIGQTVDDSYQNIENRCDDLYGLFASHAPGIPGKASDRRVYYHK